MMMMRMLMMMMIIMHHNFDDFRLPPSKPFRLWCQWCGTFLIIPGIIIIIIIIIIITNITIFFAFWRKNKLLIKCGQNIYFIHYRHRRRKWRKSIPTPKTISNVSIQINQIWVFKSKKCTYQKIGIPKYSNPKNNSLLDKKKLLPNRNPPPLS